jgi:hypothetical protein
MSWRPDPEIDELFADLQDRRLAQALRTVHAPEVTADPAFRSQLRRQLMQEAWTEAEPRLGWWRRLWAPQRVAWAMAAVGALLIAIVVYSTSSGAGDRTVLIHSNVVPSVPVAAVQPVELTFSQPMNKQTVESNLHIEPATGVTYQWTSDTQVKIVPTSGAFAPNTQYTVSLAPGAQTQQGKSVPASTPAVFTVAPPAPTPAPTPTATPAPALDVTVIGSASDIRPQWNYQDKIAAAGPNGELELFPLDGGTPEILVPAGVTAFALGPDGGRDVIAYVRGGQAYTNATHPHAASPAGINPIALGFDSQGQVEYATATATTDAQGHELKLQTPAIAAWFAPGGARMVYQSADKQLHLVELASGKETVWPGGASTFLAWSPDDTHLLYSTADGLYSSDAALQSPARLGALGGANAADWPASGPLVVEAGGQLHQVAADGSSDRLLGPASAVALAASPKGSIALVGGGKLALAQPRTPGGATALTVETAGPVVGAFEKARQSGDQAGAGAVTATTARSVAPPASGIQRWFTVAAFQAADGVHETVRVVLADKTGRDTTQLDEVLLVTAGPNGKPVISSAVDSATRPYGKGPEVLSVSQTGSKFAIEFDSDLAGVSVPAAIKLLDSSGKPVAAAVTTKGRTVMVAPATPLQSATTYRLAVSTTLLDADTRPAVAEFDVDIPLT